MPNIGQTSSALTYAPDPLRIHGDSVATGRCGAIAMVARRSDVGTIQARRFDGAAWSDMWDIGSPDGVSIDSGLAVDGAGGICYVFARGNDGRLWSKVYFDDRASWSPWWDFGIPASGAVTSAPTLSVASANNVTVYVRGAAGQVEARTWDGSVWGGWYSLGGHISSAPHAMVAGNTIMVSGRNADDGMIAISTWTGAAWAWSARRVPAPLMSATASAQNGSHLYFFGVGTNTEMQLLQYDGAAWSSVSLGGSFDSNPSAVADHAYTDVVALASDRVVHAMTHDGSKWGGSYPLTSSTAATDPATLFFDHPRVFALEPDHELYERRWTGSEWTRALAETDVAHIGTAKIDGELPNQGMGWMFEEYGYFLDDTKNYDPAVCRPEGQAGPFPLAETVELIETWSWIERHKGSYDWSRLKGQIDYWKARGKRVSLRVTTEDIGCYDPFWSAVGKDPESGGCRGIPDWLKTDLGSAGSPMQVRDFIYEFPDYTQPQYRAALSAFLTAYGAEFKDDASVDLVDLVGYGQWGEWHSGHDFKSITEREQTLDWMLDAWLNPWHGAKTFVLSGSYEYRKPNVSEDKLPVLPLEVTNPYWRIPGYGYDEFAAYSRFDRALATGNVTFRRYGFDGDRDVYPGGEHTIEPALDGALLQKSFTSGKRLPNVAELKGDYNDTDLGLKAYLPAIQNQVLQYHSNYEMIVGWVCTSVKTALDATDFYANELETYVKPALKAGGLGYRFEIAQGTGFTHLLPYPSTSLSVNLTITNRNVGRLWSPNYKMRFWLVDAAGAIASGPYDVTPPNDLRDLLKDAPTSENVTLSVARPAPGDYRLMMALVDTSGAWKPVKLAMAGMDAQTRYTVGTVRVY